MTAATYAVSGIHCSSCAAIIERKVKSIAGITNITVNPVLLTAKIESKTPVSITLINQLITPLGYSFLAPKTDTIVSKFPFPPSFFIAIITFLLMTWETLLRLNIISLSLPGNDWQHGFIFFILASTNLLIFGRLYLTAIFQFVRKRNANMNTLVGIGTIVAYLYSVFILFFPKLATSLALERNLYFDITAVVIGFIQLGKYLESRSKSKTGEAITKLINLQAKTATVIRHQTEMEVDISDVIQDDILRIKPGTNIPVDGIIIEGSSSIDESMITGESLPVDKQESSIVLGGTVNLNGFLLIKATNVGSHTMLAKIIQLVMDAQDSKAPIQRLADKISLIFVPAVLGIAVITLIIWIINGSLSTGLSAFVAVLVIACPCAMGLATPTGIVVGVGKGAEHGILIKNAESLEKLHQIDTIVIDKTGTLTTGRPKVSRVVSIDRNDSNLITILGSLESLSEHPIATSILHLMDQKNFTSLPVTNFKNLPGKGVSGTINGKQYYAGNQTLMKENGITLPENASIYVASDKLLGYVDIEDTIKPDSVETIQSLHRHGIKVVMATGDNRKIAQSISQKLNIDETHAEILPADKATIVKNLQRDGRIVAMIGDGINDAPALAQADVGIAMSTGSDIAIESSAITLLSGDIAKVEQAIRLSRATIQTIKQNLFWAFIYNVIGIPLAAGVFYPIFGILLNPIYAGAAMALSSVSVVGNSLRLKGVRL